MEDAKFRPNHSDLLIVGGGVIGCAVAYYAAMAGAKVTLLERGGIGEQASGAAAGMLVPPIEETSSAAFQHLCRASIALYPALIDALRAETDIDPQYTKSGLLLVAQRDSQARRLKVTARQWDAQWVEDEVMRSLEPGISQRAVGAAYTPEAHQVNPGLLTQALARAAEGHGAELRPGAEVTGFIQSSGRVTSVRTARGEIIAVGAVALAAGAWTRIMGRRLGVDVPVEPVRGQMIAYRSSSVRHIIWGEDGYLVPKAGGFTFAGATVENVGFRPKTTRAGLAGLRRMALALFPALRYAEEASCWAGLRPGSPDGQPIIDPLPGWENVWVTTGHSRNGVLLAPVTGKAISQLVLEGRSEVDVSAFGLGRFGG